jgi:2-keto-4-pentenoate hydratase
MERYVSMTGKFDSQPAADILASAWRDGIQLTELPSEVRPKTLQEGYDVQDRLVSLLDQSVIGWKLGVGSPKLKLQSGVGRSIAGRVFEARSFRAGDTVPLPDKSPVTVEFEIAFVLDRDVLPSDAIAAPLSAVAETRVTFELVRARFVDRRAVGWPSFAADNAGFDALIVGGTVDPKGLDSIRGSVTVTLDGKETARTLEGDDETDPMSALTDLLHIARERKMVLPKGSIISTGSVSKPFNIAQEKAEICAHFLGEELRFLTHSERR